jgi:hypothetical protein
VLCATSGAAAIVRLRKAVAMVKNLERAMISLPEKLDERTGKKIPPYTETGPEN